MILGTEIFIEPTDIQAIQSVIDDPYSKAIPEYGNWENVRGRLIHLYEYTSQQSGIPLQVCRREKLNKQAGRGAAHNNWSDYILLGVFPNGLDADRTLFIKFIVFNLSDTPSFHIQLDCDFASKDYRAPEQVKEYVHSIRDGQQTDYPLTTLYGKTLEDVYQLVKGDFQKAVQLYTQAYQLIHVSQTNSIMPSQPTIKQLVATRELNTILYGPPGTGKTYKLQMLIEEMGLVETATTGAPNYQNFVSGFTWWQLMAMALVQVKKASAPELLEHPLVKAKLSLSTIQHPPQRLWRTLQYHTVRGCPNVKGEKRSGELFFYKEVDSTWRLDNETEFKQQYPYLVTEWEAFVKGSLPSKEQRHYTFITCHQSLTYEDFVEGIKPALEQKEDGEGEEKLQYQIRKGLFYQACEKAAQLAGYETLKASLEAGKEERKQKFEAAKAINKIHVLFLDEINRCNVSAVFGELITLIEDDKRLGTKNEIADVMLPYSQTPFGVPPNLYIIGTMNTADRSVEALDTALRRRFVFEELRTDYSKLEITTDGIDIPLMLQKMNDRIEALLSRDQIIGHAWLMNVTNLAELKIAFKNKILPLLQEYFYNNYEKIVLVLGEEWVTRQKVKGIFPKNIPAGNELKSDYEEKVLLALKDAANWDEKLFQSIYE